MIAFAILVNVSSLALPPTYIYISVKMLGGMIGWRPFLEGGHRTGSSGGRCGRWSWLQRAVIAERSARARRGRVSAASSPTVGGGVYARRLGRAHAHPRVAVSSRRRASMRAPFSGDRRGRRRMPHACSARAWSYEMVEKRYAPRAARWIPKWCPWPLGLPAQSGWSPAASRIGLPHH